jgi:hypothetical protein
MTLQFNSFVTAPEAFCDIIVTGERASQILLARYDAAGIGTY